MADEARVPNRETFVLDDLVEDAPLRHAARAGVPAAAALPAFVLVRRVCRSPPEDARLEYLRSIQNLLSVMRKYTLDVLLFGVENSSLRVFPFGYTSSFVLLRKLFGVPNSSANPCLAKA